MSSPPAALSLVAGGGIGCGAVCPPSHAQSPGGFLKSSLLRHGGFTGIPEIWKGIVSSSVMKANFYGIPFLDPIFEFLLSLPGVPDADV